MDDNIKIESELLLARLRDRQQRRQDDLEALLAQVVCSRPWIAHVIMRRASGGVAGPMLTL